MKFFWVHAIAIIQESQTLLTVHCLYVNPNFFGTYVWIVGIVWRKLPNMSTCTIILNKISSAPVKKCILKKSVFS